MKQYYVYLLYHYDESIQENNTVGECLSRKSADTQEKYGSWVGDMIQLPIDKILKQVWYRDDVDEFVKNHPEAMKYSFLVHSDERWVYGKKSYFDYCPLSEQREEKLKMIL